MYRSLSSLVPNASDLLALEVEELAGVLLAHLNSYEGMAGNSVYQNGLLSQGNFIRALEQTGHGQKPEYGDKQAYVIRALMEAWAWLEREGILIRDPNQPAPWFFISRRGQRLRSQQDFEAYRKKACFPSPSCILLSAPKSILHSCAASTTPRFFRLFAKSRSREETQADFPRILWAST